MKHRNNPETIETFTYCLKIVRVAYQVGLTVEKRFPPSCLDEHIRSVRLFHGVNLADLEEDHVDKDRDLHIQTTELISHHQQRGLSEYTAESCVN